MARYLQKPLRKNWAGSPASQDGLLFRNPRVIGVWLLLIVLSGVAPAGEVSGLVTNSAAGGSSVLDPKFGLGSWIWDEETHDLQKCHFWRTFEIPAGTTVKQARLRITADKFNP